MSVGPQSAPDVHSQALSRLDVDQSFAAELYNRSGAAKFSISLSEFNLILAEVLEAQLNADADQSVLHDFLARLRIDELALARACASGNEQAWDIFINRYRDGLYSAALSIAHNDVVAHELADSLYADLFGTETSSGARVSKLRSYMGIGSLQGWLRTILAHTYIDRYRTQRAFVSLTASDDEEDDFDVPAPPASEVHPVDLRLEHATSEALNELDSEARYLLASYFLHGRTLAEIGRMLGMHESTVSRRIDKLTGRLRKKIVAGLTKRGMTRAQSEEAIEIDVRDMEVNVRDTLEETVQERGKLSSLLQEGSGTNTQPAKTGRRERNE